MTTRARAARLEIWGGAECTVNRVGDRLFDQLRRTGHDGRSNDLDDVISLGVSRLRVPVLWERVHPSGSLEGDWAWSDAYLARCADSAVRPIIGLLHHGSGPVGTDLLDPAFPSAFTAFAREVALRYPWVIDWTPINEPLTTARFSGLYGHWYPHHRDAGSFAVALVHQVRAIGSAMRAIREIIPGANLIQTEDIGFASSTPALAYQRDYENARRWWSLDLLCGDPTPCGHLEDALHDDAAARRVLREVLANPTPPAVIGINHYVTSNRHLDERTSRYPHARVGGNGRDVYVDVEAVRHSDSLRSGFGAILEETWARYGLPLALTEVQLSCTREEQMRWLHEAWSDCVEARSRGIDVLAVTPWALFGSMDWESLVTREENRYEAGVFDARTTPPRATALAGMIRSLSATGRFEHPVLDGAGWWDRCDTGALPSHGVSLPAGDMRAPILLFGAGGALGVEILRQCERRHLAVVCATRDAVDIADYASVHALMARHAPWAVINAAGFPCVERAEYEIDRCTASNEHGAANIAIACSQSDLPMLTFSSHMVFAGTKGRAYREDDETGPLNAYGRSKRAAEISVLRSLAGALIVRSGPFIGGPEESDFVQRTLRHLGTGSRLPVLSDVTVSPAYLPDLATTSLDLLIDGERGLWHLSNDGRTTWSQFAYDCAERGGMDTSLIRPVPQHERARRARLPADSTLLSTRGVLMPGLASVLDRIFQQRASAAAHSRGEAA